jgi:anthranilate synthase
MSDLQYSTPGGIAVTRQMTRLDSEAGLQHLLLELDIHRGVYLSSGYEYPGRYSRWDIACTKPPVELTARGKHVEFHALNARGEVINHILFEVLKNNAAWMDCAISNDGTIRGELKPMAAFFAEEERSKQPSVFSILRALTQEFLNEPDSHLNLIGAFGYDLLFQFEPIPQRLPRHDHKDLHLFFCDDTHFFDRKREVIERFQYDFALGEWNTAGMPRDGAVIPRAPQLAPTSITSDSTPEEYMAGVEKVREAMKAGDYYEVVLRQTFRTTYSGQASELFLRMQRLNPSPYEFLLQLGDEQMVGASPEMFLRAEGRRIETCPIAGTARRTGDPLLDHDAIRELLNSAKEESELTMCTDVDRNDKSRVCEPGSVQVIARRLIESYAGLFHTVDHVEGILQEGFDAIDAFLSHMWAVTLIGAPKRAAAVAIESIEKSARGWYGGAVGALTLNGDMNTGITIRTTYLKDGVATYPAGATLLYDSDPASEERETRLKATGFFRILGEAPKKNIEAAAPEQYGSKLLLIDHEDCFIHTLANYARQTGADVVTYRWGVSDELLHQISPGLLLISPGPGRPRDFGVPELVQRAAAMQIPIFGVCLGLQGIVEAFGGELGVLDYPMHGKPSTVIHHGQGVFAGIPERFTVGRYHSLYALRDKLPACLEVTAESADGVIMGVRHRSLPIEAVQFHPESILTLTGQWGLHLMRNALAGARMYSAR